jgi:hypothetical protein
MSDAEARREAYRPPLQNQFFSLARGSVISDEEQMQQREAMERELAEQRSRIHEN